MRQKISNTINKIRNLGISAELNPTDVMRVRLFNDLMLVGIGITIIVLIISIFNLNLPAFIPAFVAIALELSILYLMYKQKIKFVFHYSIIGFSVFFAVSNAFVDADFGAQFTFLLCIYLAYIFFDSTVPKLLVIISIVLLYLSSGYLSIFIPSEYLIKLHSAYITKSILFLFYVAWIGTLTNHYHGEVIEEEKKAKQLIETLQEQNKNLQVVSNEMERFNYIASHDLKSPLRSIIGFLDLMNIRLNQQRYEEVDEHMTYIQESSEQMNRNYIYFVEI